MDQAEVLLAVLYILFILRGCFTCASLVEIEAYMAEIALAFLIAASGVGLYAIYVTRLECFVLVWVIQCIFLYDASERVDVQKKRKMDDSVLIAQVVEPTEQFTRKQLEMIAGALVYVKQREKLRHVSIAGAPVGDHLMLGLDNDTKKLLNIFPSITQT